MKRRWIVSGLVGGIVGLAPITRAATNYVNSFNTVINAGDTTDDGNMFSFAGQVVTDNSGDVGIVAVEESGYQDVIYSANVLGTWTNVVAFDGTSSESPDVPGEGDPFTFDNLAISPAGTGEPVLTFAAFDSNTGNQGVVQWDSLAATITGATDVAFEGDGQGYTNIGGSNGLLEMQVNGSSHVLFPATNSNATGPAQSVILYGNSAAVASAFTSTSSLSNASTSGDRVGIGADGSGLAVLTSTSTGQGLYLLSSNPPPLINLGGSNYAPSTLYNPVVGYASSATGPSKLAVMVVDDTPTQTAHSIDENLLMSVNGGTARSIISQEFPVGTAVSSDTSFYGQLAPNGQFAALIPNSTGAPGNAIEYGNLTTLGASGTLATIATEAPATLPIPATAIAVDPVPHGTNLPILDLQGPGDWYPNVNSNGTVVFPANIGTATDSNQAILLWQPGDTSPQIVLSSSSSSEVTDTDVIDIDGYPAVINDFDWNSLGSDADYYKNELSDNYLALDVDYTYLPDSPTNLNPNGGAMGNAVIITSLTQIGLQVPEPTSVGLLGIAAVGLMSRRKRA